MEAHYDTRKLCHAALSRETTTCICSTHLLRFKFHHYNKTNVLSTTKTNI